MWTKVKLRQKPLADGKLSLYLDFYPPITDQVTGKKTRREFLQLHIWEKPKGSLQRQHNADTLFVAEQIWFERENALLKSNIYSDLEKDLNVAIIDCDSPQHSLVRMRERDKKAISASPYHQQLVEKQWERIQKRAYPIIGSTAEKAREAADKLAEKENLDIVFVDLPGTVQSTGVFRTIVNMDYVLTPSIPDLIVMQSTLSFATTVLDYAKSQKDVPLKDIIFFWNRLKKRSNTDVLKTYSQIMGELNLSVLDSTLPDLCRYEKEITHAKKSFFRCTMLPPPAKLLKGSGIGELADELIVKLKLK